MNRDVILVFIILIGGVTMFSIEKIRNDVAAISIMLTLAWTKVISVDQAFSGISSNAVIAIMGVMILGYGIEKTGIMDDLAQILIQKTGTNEKKVRVTIMGVTGLISSFIQNIGAVALLLPAAKKISNKSGLPSQKIIMPMAFSCMLGGTITMVGSGPVIVLNDLLSDGGYSGFGLFTVTPIGLGLLCAGILYFFVFSKLVLPSGKENTSLRNDHLLDVYNLPKEIYEVEIEEHCKLIGKSIEELKIWKDYSIHVLALCESESKTYIPWRKTTFKKGQIIAIFGEDDQINDFFKAFDLKARDQLTTFKELGHDREAGFAEIILPPDSNLKDKTIKEIALRKNYKIEPIIYINHAGKVLDFIDWPLKPGLKVIVFGRWEDLWAIKDSNEFVVISQIKPPEESTRGNKKIHSVVIMSLAILMILFGFSLPLTFFSAGLLMLFTKVIEKDELYEAIDWQTVFLLAGLIPLGIAFEETGGAKLVAESIINLIESWPVFLVLMVIGIISSFFSLFMSNVGATVLLVPLVLIMGQSFGINPRGLALLVAVSASNSFILPTHQVNAYIMGPGNYKNSDFIKAGSGMSLIFLIVSTSIIYLFYI